jgi:sugar/nucleoside kinase (ribokinase family)
MQDDADCTREALVRRIHERVAAPVFVTCGAAGLVAVDAAGTYVIPGVPVAGPTDPVGAGDAVVAALAAGLAAGLDPRTAATLANLAAAVTVRKLHTTGTATPAEILELAARGS